MASKINISNGAVTCVYDDRFRPLLEALGVMKVQRASEVEFNAKTGEWEAKLVGGLSDGVLIARGKNRNEVIAAEVTWLEEHRICPTQ